MTPEEFAKAMKETQCSDTEIAHCLADDLMCDLLKSLGYEEGIAIFLESDKWYA